MGIEAETPRDFRNELCEEEYRRSERNQQRLDLREIRKSRGYNVENLSGLMHQAYPARAVNRIVNLIR